MAAKTASEKWYIPLRVEDMYFWKWVKPSEEIMGVREEAFNLDPKLNKILSVIMAKRRNFTSHEEVEEFLEESYNELGRAGKSKFKYNQQYGMFEIPQMKQTKSINFMNYMTIREFVRFVKEMIFDRTRWSPDWLYERLFGRILASSILVDEGIRYYVYRPEYGVWMITDDKETLLSIVDDLLFLFQSMVIRYLDYKRYCMTEAEEAIKTIKIPEDPSKAKGDKKKKLQNEYREYSFAHDDNSKREDIIKAIEKFLTQFVQHERLPFRIARLLISISLRGKTNPHASAISALQESHARPELNFRNYTINLNNLTVAERCNVTFTMGCCETFWAGRQIRNLIKGGEAETRKEAAEMVTMLGCDDFTIDEVWENMKEYYPIMANFLFDFAAHDMERLRTIVLMLYLAIWPKNYHKIMTVIYGSGNSGKTTLLHMLYKSLSGVEDHYAQEMPDGVLTSVSKSASDHDGKMARFHEGIRFFWYNETTRGTPFNSKRVKDFADGTYETLIRPVGSKRIKKLRFSPYVIIATNGEALPYIPGSENDDAITNRLKCFETLCRYVDQEVKDEELLRLNNEKNEEIVKLASYAEEIKHADGKPKRDINDELDKFAKNIQTIDEEIAKVTKYWLIKDEARQELVKSKAADLLHILVLYGGRLYRSRKGTRLFDPKIVDDPKFVAKVTTSDTKAKDKMAADEWFSQCCEIFFTESGAWDETKVVTPGELLRAYKLYVDDKTVTKRLTADEFCKSLRYNGNPIGFKNRHNVKRVYGVRIKESSTNYGWAASSRPPHSAEGIK